MKLDRKLQRASSYSRSYVNRNMMEAGGFYHIHYTDETSDKQPDAYFIFVIQPNIDGKTHCLDLAKIEEGAFDSFFDDVRLEDDSLVLQLKLQHKGYVKPSIKSGKGFYTEFIKSNKDLMRNKPYKTLLFDRIQNVRYIAYDLEEKLEE